MRDDDSYEDAGSRAEVAAFKKGLANIDRETLRDHLTQRTITRKWKRELVEAEYALRAADDPDSLSSEDGAAPGRMRLHTRNWGRWTAGIIISLCCLILFYTLYEFWAM